MYKCCHGNQRVYTCVTMTTNQPIATYLRSDADGLVRALLHVTGSVARRMLRSTQVAIGNSRLVARGVVRGDNSRR